MKLWPVKTNENVFPLNSPKAIRKITLQIMYFEFLFRNSSFLYSMIYIENINRCPNSKYVRFLVGKNILFPRP